MIIYKTKLIISFSVLCLTLNTALLAQNVLTGKKIHTHTTDNLAGYNKSNTYSTALDKFLTAYEVFEIEVKKEQVDISTANPYLKLNLDQRSYDMNLFQDNITLRYKSKKKPLLLGGSLRSGGIVSLTLNDDFLYGFIKEGQNTTYIEPLHYLVPSAPKGLYVTYDINAVIPDKEHKCGVDETMQQANNFLPTKTITSCKIIELAIANTRNMITKYGNNTATENHNLGVLNNVQTHYRSEFTYNVEFDVVAHYFPTTVNNNPLSPNTNTTNASTLLGNFRTWARSGNQGGGNTGGANGGFGVDYNLASLWTDRDITFGGSSGTVGLAYTPGWHHLLEDYTSTAASIAIMVTHEKAHNFSANHDGSGTDFIMAPSVTVTENWSAASKNKIDSRLNSMNYLNNCSTLGAPTANFFQSAMSICSGSTVVYEDQSQYGATRTWAFTGGSPVSSTNEKPSVTYNTTGMHLVTITSTNSAGSDTHMGYVDVQAPPSTICTPGSGSGGSGGITGVNLNGMSNSSTVTGLYENFACTAVAAVEPGTSYNMIVGVSNVTRLRFFVDYNDDGDFSDSGEASALFSFSGNGNLGVTLNTAANPVLGELLRMRVIVSTSSISADGCTDPSTGQVEDYSMYFPESQVLGCTDPNASNYDPNATIDDGSCNTGGIPLTWYRDLDNDGYGNPNNTTVAVSQPSGYLSNNTDCNDNNANVNPGATEICDGLDNNCNGATDEGVTNTYYRDNDNDGYGNASVTTQACSSPSGYVTNNTDCNDNNANVNPGATEICDGLDNNCNGATDEGVTNTYYRDNDNDGYGNASATTQACSLPSGYVTNNTDCNDNNANVTLGATYYADNDGDGYGNPNNTTTACSLPSGHVTNNSDCNDNNANVNPGENEICDGLDNNCNGSTDEGCNTGNNNCDGSILVINTITQNIYRAEISITSSATVNGSGNVLFAAGNAIELQPGFEVILGTDFEARIESCTNFTSGSGTTNYMVDLGDLNDKITENFPPGSDINVIIYNSEKTSVERKVTSDKIGELLNKLSPQMEKGSYKLKLSGGGKEIEQEIFIIK